MLNTKAKFAVASRRSGYFFLFLSATIRYWNHFKFFRSRASNLRWSVFFKVRSRSLDPAVFFCFVLFFKGWLSYSAAGECVSIKNFIFYSSVPQLLSPLHNLCL